MIEFSAWEIAYLLTAYIVTAPFIYTYRYAKRRYKRASRIIEIQKTHTKAWRSAREAREAANRDHPFMRLPPEIRNRVYAISMVSDAVVHPLWGYIHELRPLDEKQHCLAIHSEYPRFSSQLYPDERHYESRGATAARMANMSQVCKVWRAEAVRLYYGTNVFELPIGEYLWKRKPHPDAYSPAVRKYYTRWFRRLPKEAFPVLRLVLHDYRRCPHISVERSPSCLTEQGSCLIFVDFQRQIVAAVKGTSPPHHRDLWHCGICWGRYVDEIFDLNGSKEARELFVRFQDHLNAAAATRVVDRLRIILEKRLEQAVKVANDSWA